MFVRRVLAIAFLAASVSPLSEAQEPVRVFVSDGETWEIAGASQPLTAATLRQARLASAHDPSRLK